MVFGVYHHCQQVKKCEKIEEKKNKDILFRSTYRRNIISSISGIV